MRKYVIALIVLAATPAMGGQFEYSAKFACGRASGDVVKSFATSPGVYYTTISVANPNADTVKGRTRFMMSRSMTSEQPTKPTDWSAGPMAALQIDCGTIYKYFGVEPGKFMEGFVFLDGGPTRFQVAATYSLFDGNYPASIDVKHLVPRLQP